MLTNRRLIRKKRIRSRVSGTKDIPRLSVFRSNKEIYAQLINDDKGVTLTSARGKDAKAVGQEISEGAKKAKITAIVFDRSGYRYHGKVKAVAEAAREGGLKF
jgi:large subunit ribosomal protein L18